MICCYLCDDCQNELNEAIDSAEAMAVSGAIQRIDRDDLAERLADWYDLSDRIGFEGVADAVLAALPELMGGEER